jgi:hypothetical protein
MLFAKSIYNKENVMLGVVLILELNRRLIGNASKHKIGSGSFRGEYISSYIYMVKNKLFRGGRGKMYFLK